jgi:hypothetical protein
VSLVRYKLGFYIPEDDILYSHHHENSKSYIVSSCYLVCVTRETGLLAGYFVNFFLLSCHVNANITHKFFLL